MLPGSIGSIAIGRARARTPIRPGGSPRYRRNRSSKKADGRGAKRSRLCSSTTRHASSSTRLGVRRGVCDSAAGATPRYRTARGPPSRHGRGQARRRARPRTEHFDARLALSKLCHRDLLSLQPLPDVRGQVLPRRRRAGARRRPHPPVLLEARLARDRGRHHRQTNRDAAGEGDLQGRRRAADDRAQRCRCPTTRH